MKQIFVAEVKTHSPFGWESKESWEELFEIADQYGDVISIHFSPGWGGSFELIEKARSRTTKPILAKGILDNSSHLINLVSAGANYVLVAETNNLYYERSRANDILNAFQSHVCWHEPYANSSIHSGWHDWTKSNRTIVINSRNLQNGKRITEPGVIGTSWETIRRLHSGKLVQASLIRQHHDIFPDADAYIVGTHLKNFCRERSTIIGYR